MRVVVDENGKVISAEATDGPLPLREAAEAAHAGDVRADYKGRNYSEGCGNLTTTSLHNEEAVA